MQDREPLGIQSAKNVYREKAPVGICEFCGQDIWDYASTQKRHYCSKKCRSRKASGRKPEDYAERPCADCTRMFVPPSTNTRYCSQLCSGRAAEKRRKERLITEAEIDNTANGLARELLVCSDLLLRGAHVFKSIRNNGPCDIVILFENKLYRVEATSGYRKKDGNLYWCPHDPAKYDLLAVVFGNRTVHYLPDIFAGKLGNKPGPLPT